MGKTFRKTPIISNAVCGDSEKQDKRRCNRRFRQQSKIRIAQDKEPFIFLREALNRCSFKKDGKSYIKRIDLRTHWQYRFR